LVAPETLAQECTDSFVRSVLRPPQEARCIGFKEIRYTDEPMSDAVFAEYLDFMRERFPRAAIVFNFWNIHDAAKSGWWKDMDPKVVLPRLALTRDRMRRYAEANTDCTTVFEYDSLMESPDYFRTLCDFLGEEYDEYAVSQVLSRVHSTIDGRKSLASRGHRPKVVPPVLKTRAA
jgi:hypothetical protein